MLMLAVLMALQRSLLSPSLKQNDCSIDLKYLETAAATGQSLCFDHEDNKHLLNTDNIANIYQNSIHISN
jgi:hypothetical protein